MFPENEQHRETLTHDGWTNLLTVTDTMSEFMVNTSHASTSKIPSSLWKKELTTYPKPSTLGWEARYKIDISK